MVLIDHVEIEECAEQLFAPAALRPRSAFQALGQAIGARADDFVKIAFFIMNGIQFVECDFSNATISRGGGCQFPALAKFITRGDDVVQFSSSQGHGVPLVTGMLKRCPGLPAKWFRIAGRRCAG